MKASTETLVGVLAGIIIAGIFLAVAYQLLASFGIEQQRKQAITSLSEIANGVDYACGAGEGSSMTVSANLPLMVKEVTGRNDRICLLMDITRCLPTHCSVNMTPLSLNSTFIQTRAKASKQNVVQVEFSITRFKDGVNIESRLV